MSHSISIAKGKFVVHDILIMTHRQYDLDNEHNCMLAMPESYSLGEFDFQPNIKYPLENITLNGWTFNNKIKNIKNLYLYIWKKDDLECFTLDESQYSHVGDHEISVVSDDEHSLLEFLKDFNINKYEILTDEPIQQWG